MGSVNVEWESELWRGNRPASRSSGRPSPRSTTTPTTGRSLREFLEGRNGSIGSVGRGGLALDLYKGVVQVCTERNLSGGEKADDRFFLVLTSDRRGGREALPAPFRSLAAETSDGPSVITAGPRRYRDQLADLADILVVVNGGSGALRQANKVLMKHKPVLAVESSGGAARLLGAIRTSGRLSASLRKMLDDEGIDLETIPQSAVHPVQSEVDLIDRIESLQ